ncbi:MAG: hypothetical protein V7K48_29715 [Nostoc sp.]|uniref:hypothetical protein n=1 Tax=Nostoc sp. TaxID=1180 RepID=UPI002FF51BAF
MKTRDLSNWFDKTAVCDCWLTVKLCGGRYPQTPTSNLCSVRTNAVLGGDNYSCLS